MYLDIKTLRKFDFCNNTSLTSNVASSKLFQSFLSSKQLWRTNLTSKFSEQLVTLQSRIVNRVHPYRLYEFGDINMKICDPTSVLYALTIVGEELNQRQCLTINELTFYFVRARYNL
jgi:hypothetical protein